MGKRGSVLLHVMMTAVLVAIIAATLMRMSLLRQAMMARGAAALQNKRNDQAGLASALETWAAASSGVPCSAIPAGYSQSGPTGTCGCTLTSNALDAHGVPLVTVYSCPNNGGVCAVSVNGAPAGNPPVCKLSIVSGE